MSLPHTPARSPAAASRRVRRACAWPFVVLAVASASSSATAFVVGPASSRSTPPGLRRPAALPAAGSGSGSGDDAFLTAVRSKVQARTDYQKRQTAARDLKKGERLRDQDEPHRAARALRLSIANDPSCARAHFLYASCISEMGLRYFDAAVASYRTGIILSGQDDRTSGEQLAEYLTDFALTLVHIPAAATPNELRQVEEARKLIEYACSLVPTKGSLRYEYAVFQEEFAADPSEVEEAFSVADRVTEAEVAAQLVADGVEVQWVQHYVLEAEPLVLTNPQILLKPGSAGATEAALDAAWAQAPASKPARSFMSRTPFLFWA